MFDETAGSVPTIERDYEFLVSKHLDEAVRQELHRRCFAGIDPAEPATLVAGHLETRDGQKYTVIVDTTPILGRAGDRDG